MILKIIEKVKKQAKENYVPIVRDETLKMLLKVCKENQVKNVLEIGTATGYSALNMLSIEGIKITTIEKNEQRVKEAKLNFEEAGVGDRITLVNGDAGEILKNLVEANKKFDLVFLDGPKGQYVRYLANIKILLREGGILFSDNILLGGLIKDESLVNHKNRAMVNNMKKFLDEIKTGDDFNSKFYEIEDGFAISEIK